MSSVLRRRIPWGSGVASSATEEIPLIESGSSSILEGAAAEETAFGVFATAEEAGAALDATGVGAPIGIGVGVLAAAGFGIYEIYEHFHKENPSITEKKVQHYYDKAKNNPNKHIAEYNKRLETYKNNQPAIEPLEHQFKDVDVMTLEDQVPHDTYYQTLPGSKYIGPGNPVDSGTPTNRVDFAAKQHDIAYSEAKNNQDVRQADIEFKQSAQNSVAEALSFGGNPIEGLHGAAGYLGIQSKNLFEDTFYHGESIYPSFTGKTWLLQIEQIIIKIIL